MSMTKEDAVRRIHECALAYKANLLGKNVLFVTLGNNNTALFETVYLARNFLHFTGTKSSLNSRLFFQAAVDNKLGTKDIAIASDGTTELKLQVLLSLMSIHITARMVGDYGNSKSLLVADKFAGTVTAAMGFVDDNGYYVPNTVLNEDIRRLTQSPRQRIVATFIKDQKEKVYTTLTYTAKGITLEDSKIASAINDKVDIGSLTPVYSLPEKSD